MTVTSAAAPLRVALLGFGEFERSALVSYLRLLGFAQPAYEQARVAGRCGLRDRRRRPAGTVDAVLGRRPRGRHGLHRRRWPPEGALAWMMRPIDPLQVLRETRFGTAAVRCQSRVAGPVRPCPTSSRTARSSTLSAAAHRAPSRRQGRCDRRRAAVGHAPPRRDANAADRRGPAGRRQRDRAALPASASCRPWACAPTPQPTASVRSNCWPRRALRHRLPRRRARRRTAKLDGLALCQRHQAPAAKRTPRPRRRWW